MSNTADVLIIGGGVHGASLAFHLAERGVKATVLERRSVAGGATGRSSGLVRMHYDLEPESRLAWISFQYFRNWKERVGGDCDFTRTGFLQLVPEKHEEELKANVIMHQKIGIPSLLVTPEDVKRLAPSFYVDDFNVAAYEPESGYADAYSATMGFLTAARAKGAQLVQDCEVTAIHTSGGKVTGVSTTQGDFSAPIVVNAAGPWADRVSKMVDVEIPLTTWQHDTMFVKRPAEIGPSHPVMIDNIHSMYFRPESGGLTLVGLEDDNPLGEDPDGSTEHAKPNFVERAIDRICQRVPIMEQGGLHSAHGGYDGLTPDQRAIIGPAGPDGFFLQTGMSGTGFKIAPAVGLCMSQLIIDGQASEMDIAPFRYSRFEEGDLLEGKNAYDAIWH